jgi:hypothetical protein
MLFLSKNFNVHPTCYVLKGLQLPSSRPIAGGGFGDVYQGDMYSKLQRFHSLTGSLGILRGEEVCVKTVRLFRDSEVDDLLKVFLSIQLTLSIHPLPNNLSSLLSEKPQFGDTSSIPISCLFGVFIILTKSANALALYRPGCAWGM